MGKISVNPEHMRHVARRFWSASSEVSQMINRARPRVEAAEGEWEGNRKNKFEAQHETWVSQMSSFSRQLSRIGSDLNSTADRFAAADTQDWD